MGEKAGNGLFTRRKPGGKLFAFYEQIKSQDRNPGDVILQCKPYRKAGLSKEIVAEIAGYKGKQKPYTLHENAERLSKALQAGTERYADLTEMTQRGYLPGVTALHMLRSFAWTAGDYKKRIGLELENLSEKELTAVVKFIADTEFLNYRGGSFCPGLCSFPDKDVVFVPEILIRRGTARFKPYGYPASLNRLQKDLIRLKPVMEGIAVALFAGVVSEENRMVYSSVLAAWCTLASASREPFLLSEGPKQYRKKTASKKISERALPEVTPEGIGRSVPKEAVFEAADIVYISKRLLELQEEDMVANNDPGRERTVEELIAELMGSATQPKAPEPAPAPAPVEPEWEVTPNEPENDIEPEWEVSYVSPASAPEKPMIPAPAPVVEPAPVVPEPVAPAPAVEPAPAPAGPVVPDPNYVPPEPSYFFNQSILESLNQGPVVEPAPAPAEPAATPEPAPAASDSDPMYFFNQSILESLNQGPIAEPIAPAPAPVVEPVPAPVVPEPVAEPAPAPVVEPTPAPEPAPAKPVSTIPNIAPSGETPAASTYETNQASKEEIDEHEAAVRRRMREILEQNKRKQQEKDEVRRQMEERRLEVARRQEQRRQEILAKRKADYERLCNEQEELRKVVEENKNALMGERKRKRIDAQKRIDDIEDIILKEYLDLKRGTNDYHTGLTQEL